MEELMHAEQSAQAPVPAAEKKKKRKKHPLVPETGKKQKRSLLKRS